eukprot:scaffold38901_cov66-Phaeocystis_antarctica.AAC.3
MTRARCARDHSISKIRALLQRLRSENTQNRNTGGTGDRSRTTHTRTHASCVPASPAAKRIEAGQQWYLPEEECSDWGAI